MNKEHVTTGNDEKGTAFIDSMRKKFEARSREIAESMETEARKLKDASARDLEEFIKKTQLETDNRIAAELEKLNNRAEIDKRKAKLALIEEITQDLIARALDLLRKKRKDESIRFYRTMLVKIAGEAQQGPVLYCSKDDREMMELLRNDIEKETGASFTVETDDSIQGGFMIYDHEGGKTFNYTFERMVYRRLDEIRRQVYQAIADSITIDSE